MTLSKADKATVNAIGESVHRYAKIQSDREWQKGYLIAMEMALQIVRSCDTLEQATAALDLQVVGMRAVTKTERITEQEVEAHQAK